MTGANLEIIKQLKEFLQQVRQDPELKQCFSSAKAFTKERKLPLDRLVYLIISLLKKSLSVELEDFFKINYQQSKSASKAALSKQRQKLDYSFFVLWNSLLVQCFYKYYEKNVKRWKGFRLMAMDGSTAYLINKPELSNYFGTQDNQSVSVTMGRIMTVYDVLNEISVFSAMYPITFSEPAIAYQWIPHLNKDALTIYDRGFPSFTAFYLHLEQEETRHFVMRCKNAWNKEVKAFTSSALDSQIVTLKATDKAIDELLKHGYKITRATSVTVRLVKVVLKDGTIETLITSLLDEQEYPVSLFADLYFKRWGIETNYSAKKNSMQLEILSGYKVNSVLQDFYATVFIDNLQNILTKPAQEIVDQSTRNRKYPYKINKNVSLGILKQHIVNIFATHDPTEIIKVLILTFSKHTEPVRKGRSSPRVVKHKRKKGKYCTLTNYKRAI